MRGIGNSNLKLVKKFNRITLVLLVLAGHSVTQSAAREPYTYVKPQDRLIIDLFNAGALNQPAGMNIRNWSPGFSVSVMHNLRLGRSNFALAAGYGFSSLNLHVNGNFQALEGTGPPVFVPFGTGYAYTMHKTVANYIEVPVEVRFRTKDTVPFKCSIGGTIGYAVSSHTKTIDSHSKTKQYNVHGLESLRYGLTGRMGFGRFSAFAAWYVSPLVNSPQMRQMRVFTLGVSIQMI